MPAMTANEIRGMSNDALSAQLTDLAKELFALRMQKSIGASVKTQRFSQIRKEVARIKTIMNERKGAENE